MDFQAEDIDPYDPYMLFLLKNNKNLIPLGGINQNNLNSLKTINSKGFALMSEIKKKPANIINRLF